jgi:hypothetical protein
MVKEGKSCNVGVERLGIVEVTDPIVVYNILDEDLDVALSSLISLVVLNQGGPGCFGANAVDARSFRVVRVPARRMDGWAYEGSAIVVKIPVGTGNESPEVVDAINMVVGGLEKNRQDGI